MDTTTPRIGMPLDLFLEAANDQNFEPIKGAMRIELPSVAGHSYVIHTLFSLLLAHFTNVSGKVFIRATYIWEDAYDRDWVMQEKISISIPDFQAKVVRAILIRLRENRNE